MVKIKSDDIKLNTSYSLPELDLNKYKNLWVGMEIEFNGGAGFTEISTYYDIPTRKTYKKVKNIKKQLTDGSTINIPQEIDIFKQPNILCCIYNDGSIEKEIVTRHFQLKEIHKIKQVYDDLINKFNVNPSDFFYRGKGGLHLTFLLDYHKENSKYEDIVVKNIMQLMRIFYKTIIKLFAEYKGNYYESRATYFRKYPSLSEVTTLNTNHYTATNIKKRREGGRNENIWAVEIRLPDGTSDLKLIEKQIRFYQALILQAAKISRFGFLEFEQRVKNDNYEFYLQKADTDYTIKFKTETTEQRHNKTKLYSILKASLIETGYYKKDNLNISDNKKERIIKLILAGYTELDILKQEAITRTQFERIREVI